MNDNTTPSRTPSNAELIRAIQALPPQTQELVFALLLQLERAQEAGIKLPPIEEVC